MKLLRTISFVFLALIIICKGKAQEVFNSGARFQSMADASSALTGCWSVFGNQAGLAEVDQIEIAGSFQNRFLVSELSSREGILILPIPSGVFGLAYSQFGKNSFRQEKVGFAFARSIGPKLRFGVQFTRYGLFLIEENQNIHVYGLDVGAQYISTAKNTIGIRLLNPYQTEIKLSSDVYRYDSSISVGDCYRVSPDFSWLIEVENRFDEHVMVKSGFEFDVLKCLTVRAGVAGKPFLLSAGFGFKYKKVVVDFATTYNQYLGNSPTISLQYQF